MRCSLVSRETELFAVGAHLACALNLVPESTSGAHEVRPYIGLRRFRSDLKFEI